MVYNDVPIIVKCHFLLERNWKEGQYVLHPRFDQNGAHRIQVDEVEGTILSTRTAGALPYSLVQTLSIELLKALFGLSV